MKKNLTIFIVAIISIFGIGTFKVNALVDTDLDYDYLLDKIDSHTEEIGTIIGYFDNYISDKPNFGYVVYAQRKNNNDFCYVIHLMEFKNDNKVSYWKDSTSNATGYKIYSSDVKYRLQGILYSSSFKIDFNTFKIKVEDYYNNVSLLTNTSYDMGCITSISNNKVTYNGSDWSNTSHFILYSSYPVEYGGSDRGSQEGKRFYLGNNYLNKGDIVPNVWEYYIKSKSQIELSKGYACDLDGTDMYIITADFEKIFDTGLIYQIKIGNNDWQDISNLIYDLEYTEENGYRYVYNAYYNLEFKARVLYQDGTIKDEKSISVTELLDISLKGYKKFSFPDGYDYAIIRSEKLDKLSISLMIQENYFLNSEVELFNVDYFRKEVFGVYDNFSDYKVSDRFLKFPVTVDEVNYFFPVLHRTTIELVDFYVSNDCYVVFSNKEGSDVIVDGSDKDIIIGENVDIKYLVSLIEDFLNNNQDETKFVQNILQIFFNEMPRELYQAIVMILFVIFIGVIIAIVGWK